MNRRLSGAWCARAQPDTFWRAGNDKPVSPFEEGGPSSSAGIGVGSAAVDAGAGDLPPPPHLSRVSVNQRRL